MSLLLSRKLTVCSFAGYAATQADPVSRGAGVWMLRKPDKYIVSFRFNKCGRSDSQFDTSHNLERKYNADLLFCKRIFCI
ncbi:hypothetical protein A3194_16205 [Candidatus Thiodiazotropha endoloripes]|nr:hypothetical protein A3194_16205 [Candidatus Thiodiazotropha endoloripes]ODB83407.1 hypothetical protein A3193_10825 [Candidatus Thiodiazotropha endoloripes]